VTWSSPFNKGYNNTIVDYVFFPQQFETRWKGAWVLEKIYSFKTQLRYYSREELTEKVFKNYLLNPWGVLFSKHKDKLAEDVQKIIDSMKTRKEIKNAMLVLEQLFENIVNGNRVARQVALRLMSNDTDINEAELQDAGIWDTMQKKKVPVTDLVFSKIQAFEDEILESLETAIQDKDLAQNARKVFMNSGFGIKGLISFIFSAPLLGNAITSAGKIYGIKVAQNVAAQCINARNLAPSL